MYAPGHQMFAYAMNFQWASEGLWPWFNDGRITVTAQCVCMLKAVADNKIQIKHRIMCRTDRLKKFYRLAKNIAGKTEVVFTNIFSFPKQFPQGSSLSQRRSVRTWERRVTSSIPVSASLFVWGFTPYQQYFSYLTATVHKSMFSWTIFLTST